jgi:cyclophilin family peptidyl-prolyl cis-trans isomerase
MKTLKIILVIALVTLVTAYADGQVKKTVVKNPVAMKKSPGIRIKLTTDSGIIIIRLYDSTPLHRDNFVKLVKNHFFDSLLFHRVIKGFMIQGGDPLSKNAKPGEALGMGGGDMPRTPAEFRPALLHKKGVLAAARDGNPEKASSACQFYLVQGRVCSDAELNQAECSIRQTNPDFYYTDEQRKIYKTIGGTPMLDMGYTVFGEVEKGIDVIDKIASVPTAPGDRPVGDVRMKMEVIK